jgi:lantibiotic modifying enzyme
VADHLGKDIMTKRNRIWPSAVLATALLGTSSGGKGPALEAALKAARWIESHGVTAKTPGARDWPADPSDPASVNLSLYAGTPGIVLFFLEAWQSTGDRGFLDQARGGADSLLAGLAGEAGTGLYQGVAGIGFALEETFKATRDPKYRTGLAECLKKIESGALRKGRGVEWGTVTDVISGGAGTGLFLLTAARELGEKRWLELAAEAGRRLIELGLPEKNGLKWAMDPGFPRLMPNFSHGTAGIAYFLARLHEETGDAEFLRAAVAGAGYLKSVANTEGEGCLVFHNEPDGRDLYYLGWCHGPTGTARLFYELWKVTGNSEWLDWTKRSARAILASGIPEKETPGFWNNAGVCCGLAGVGDFFLDLFRAVKDKAYLDFSRRVSARLLSRATAEGDGLKWIQAEHRTKPDLLIAQTGLMQGAAGIGLFLLHEDAENRGRARRIVLPDTPFR